VLRNRGRPRGNLRALYGGSGGDVIRGGADEDLLTGGAGADRIDAGAGDDDIWGNRGRDRILAGRGDDEIHARDSARDSVVCGPGSDALGADPRDRFSSSCETVAQRAVREGPNVVIGDARLRRNSRLRVRLSCPRKVGRLGCSGLLAGRLAGSRRNGPATRYRIRARRSRAVTIRLRRADARRIRRRARGTVRIRSVERGHLGRKITIREVDIRA
jgi:hypothetical protein